ncbi:MAG: adenosylmethionine decarboxylase [Patescibacteria group bacterium]|nr:adenosylmethionine decarboxylase [Patescibacteria group bacterium]
MSKIVDIFIDHHIAELEGVDFEFLNDQDKLLQAAKNVAQNLGLTVVNSFIHRFEPHGLSLVLVISQSHIAIHTWPEYGYMHLDIMTCSEGDNLQSLESVLQQEFTPSKITVKKIDY